MRSPGPFLLLASFGLSLPACAPDAVPPPFEIVVLDHAFQAPTEVAGGWVTSTVDNTRAREVHEVTFTRLPEGLGWEAYRDQVLPVWEEVWRYTAAGEPEEAEAALEALPEWAAEVEYVHARGLVSPGHETGSTLYLEPGEYVIECWVLDPQGRIHGNLGMIRPLRVAEPERETGPPAHDVALRMVDGELDAPRVLAPGTHVVRVLVDAASGFDNVHLVRLDQDTGLEGLFAWMDWYGPGGLQDPAPATFLGGGHAYASAGDGDLFHFTVRDLAPGRYAWVVAGPDPLAVEVVVE